MIIFNFIVGVLYFGNNVCVVSYVHAFVSLMDTKLNNMCIRVSVGVLYFGNNVCVVSYVHAFVSLMDINCHSHVGPLTNNK